MGFYQVLFDFDYNDSFYDLGINIDARFSTASTDGTLIYGSNTSRVKGYDFDSFIYDESAHIFSSKSKLSWLMAK